MEVPHDDGPASRGDRQRCGARSIPLNRVWRFSRPPEPLQSGEPREALTTAQAAQAPVAVAAHCRHTPHRDAAPRPPRVGGRHRELGEGDEPPRPPRARAAPRARRGGGESVRHRRQALARTKMDAELMYDGCQWMCLTAAEARGRAPAEPELATLATPTFLEARGPQERGMLTRQGSPPALPRGSPRPGAFVRDALRLMP
eukprot:gene12795-biopygen50